MKVKFGVGLGAITGGLAALLASASMASAAPPTCSEAANYLAFTSVNVATWVGADTQFKASGWYLESCLTGPGDVAHVVIYHRGRNFGGAGNPEDVRVEANVYKGVFSDEGCNNGAVRSLNDGYLDTRHDHYQTSGTHSNNNIGTAC